MKQIDSLKTEKKLNVFVRAATSVAQSLLTAVF